MKPTLNMNAIADLAEISDGLKLKHPRAWRSGPMCRPGTRTERRTIIL